MERVPTGIEGLDTLLSGGFVRKRHVLISGGPGTGKTTVGYEYLYRGAEQYNEKGLFVSLEQSPDRVVEGAKAVFSKWNWDKHLVENIIFTRILKDDFDKIRDVIRDYVEGQDVKRIVIDSLTILRLYFRTEDAYRNNLYELLEFLADFNATCVLTVEKSHTKRGDAVYDMEEFVADGLIRLYLIPKERDRLRALEVVKMRDVEHSMKLCPFKITSEGLLVSPEAPMFAEVE
jgi:KaiC/GvpD/RAD55 family RecA-like ATPase